MYCVKCQKHVVECKCPDIEERLLRIASHPNIVTEVCVKCGEHRDRCKCPQPKLQRTGILNSSN